MRLVRKKSQVRYPRYLLDCDEKVANGMTRQCHICKRHFLDGEEIVAAMVTVFHDVPSRIAYAVEQPSDCLAMCHRYCYGDKNDHNTENVDGD